jgi:eukaryotic-like serine/threonine-protein kinase
MAIHVPRLLGLLKVFRLDDSAKAALLSSNDREAEYGAGLALALSGDSSLSSALATDLEKRFPEDTSVRFSYLPTLQAVLALSQ